ncbi:MAG TPA: hypothetical protein PKW28_12875, partial [Turneriella sp.]|nr:hypothetical protein [Turneriella sp.]
MAKDSADAENFSRLLKAILPGELESLQAQDWQSTPLPGEAVYARFEKPAGITGLGGALPFLETHKGENPEGFTWTRSDNLARFLTENRSLCRSYLTLARADRLALHGAPGQAQLLQCMGHRIDRVLVAKAAVDVGVDGHALLLVGVPVLPAVVIVVLAVHV